ncbi:MAG TPA: carboxypeptidase regulatory-like domain-containing protein [Candidatus Sulfomarinibacteraceae bacterium]|nr:carboxypeptidase regulatory-like domain-containing protein [Candidatus Sulfomarinibacteraceae bacterium]
MTARRPLIALLALALAALAPQAALGQSDASTGQLFGTVTDPEGASLPGATVEARNTATGFARRTATDRSGIYRIDLVPVGTYEVRAALAGFNTQVYRDVSVGLGAAVRLEFALELSAVEEEIVVTAEAPVVDTTNPNTSSTVSDQQIANLPLNGRDFTDFVLLTPGATFGDTDAVQGARGGLNVGARAIQNSFNIDGTNSQSSFFGEERGGTRPPFTFSQAAIQELQVIKSDYGTQFSSSGAVINAITKSGTNTFRGEVWTYSTDDSMVGDTAGNDNVDPREPREQTQIQYGFSLGGPIVRDRLHFFTSVDAQDFETPTFVRFRDFPFDRVADWEALTGLGFATETGGQASAESFGEIGTTNDALVFLVKLDWQLGADHLLTLRDNYATQEGENLTSGFDTTGLSNNGLEENSFNSLVVSLNSVLSENVFNEAYLQWSVEERPRTANVTSIPEVGIFQFRAAFGQNNFLPNHLDEERVQLIDNLTVYSGDHTFKLGVNLDFVTFDDGFLRYGGGSYSYNDWENEPDLGQFDGLLDGGTPFSYTQAFSDYDGTVTFSTNYYALYFQDEWRLAPSFTLTYGLRYELQDHDDPKETNPLYPFTGQIPDDGDNFAPRVGFAWDIGGEGKAVLRGGVGIFYDNTPTLLDANAMLTNGIRVVRYSVRCASNPGVCPDFPDRWSSPDELGDAVKPDIFVYDPSFENPQTLRASIGYERELASNFSLGVDVIYQDTEHLQRKWDQNLRPDGGTTPDGRPTYVAGEVYDDFDQIMQFFSDAEQEYRAVIIHGRKRFAGRWFLDASYTWASSKDHDSNERSVSSSSDFPEDQFNLDSSWGYSNFDVRHKLVASFGWQLPANFLISGIYTWRSGFPYTAGDGRDNNTDGYFNDRALVEASPGVYVHSDRNTERQPDFQAFDLRLSWTANLGRDLQLELIGEVFNLFDSSNWLTDEFILVDRNGTIDPDFGSLTIPGSPRIFQVGAKFRF